MELEDNKELNSVLKVLNQVKKSGAPFTVFTEPFNDFDVRIKNHESLKFPMTEKSAKELIKNAEFARFGLGKKTILDLKVRNAWEISADKISIKEKGNSKIFENALQKIKTKLGLSEKHTLKAELHNLLIYEEGQFFQTHQDSEKKNGMIASLVVVLPSHYEGGAFKLEHKGTKKTITNKNTSNDKLTFIAFYSDCQHEVLRVKKGYRVALTFNLILEKSKNKLGDDSFFEIQPILDESLNNYFNKNEEPKLNYFTNMRIPRRLVYLLDHEYTPKGISWQTLKNIDISRAELLKNAANNLGLEVHLCLVELHETWNCIPEYSDWENNYYDDDDEESDENDEIFEDDYTLDDLIDSDVTAKHWMNTKGKKMLYPETTLFNWDIIWSVDTEDFSPFKKEYEGYMGNYGNTEDRWYHRAAIVLWRKVDSQAVYLDFNPEEVISTNLALAESKKTYDLAKTNTQQFIPFWKGFGRSEVSVKQKNEIVKLSILLNDKSLGMQLLTPMNFAVLCPETASNFKDLIEFYGADWCIKLAKKWVDSKTYFSECYFKKIDKIINKMLSQDNVQTNQYIDWMLHFQLNHIKKSHLDSKRKFTLIEIKKLAPARIGEILEVLAGCIAINALNIIEEIFDYILKHIDIYSYKEISPCLAAFFEKYKKPVLNGIKPEVLLAPIIDLIEKELKTPERVSSDWSIRNVNRCKCEDCLAFKDFLMSRNETQKVWLLGEKRRWHIQQVIDEMQLPVSSKIDKKTRPYKLLLEKTNRLFTEEKELRQSLKMALVSFKNVLEVGK